jgi:metallo-beta-lactamase class B
MLLNFLRLTALILGVSSRLLFAQDPSWTEPFPPHKIMGNLYYVGSTGLASYLITTPRGHILINSSLVSSVPLIEKSIRQLGFRFEDVKILLISHAHWDHCAGSDLVRRRIHASYMVMDADVPVVEDGGRSDFQYGKSPQSLFPPTKVDRILHDGDTVQLGGSVLTAHLTPGHTKGCTTWTLQVKQAGKTYNVVIVGSPNVNPGYKLVNNPLYPNIAQDYQKCFRILAALPCDIFLGAHGGYYDMLDKYSKLKEGQPNPFIDPAGYRAYVADREEAFEREFHKQSLESTVLQFPVPDALRLNNGQPVTDSASWSSRRRPDILAAFADQVYGKTPSTDIRVTSQVTSTDRAALNGTAIRREITLTFEHNGRSHRVPFLFYLPAHASGPVPVIIGLNFAGNQTVDSDRGITLPSIWQADPSDANPVHELRRHVLTQATSATRGAFSYRWQIPKLLAHGYGLATAYYGDIEPDFDGSLKYGVRNIFLAEGQTKFAPEEWGAIGAWAWGLSRIADYLVTNPAVDSHRLGVFGFSRLGKASMWAAAQDQRFALVISNESGVGGAGLYRTKTGETIQHLNSAFPHWFCENFHQYTGHPDQVPVAGNMLLALVAPRPLYVASAELDRNSDPEGEFLSAVLAGQVYRLFGKHGLETEVMPPLNSPIFGDGVAYHDRSGKHEVTEYDWEQYLRFADSQFRRSK